jgi:hypothetical protein
MDSEYAAAKVLNVLKDEKLDACSLCIATAAGVGKSQIQGILDTLVGIGKAQRIGSKASGTTIAMGCWKCGKYDVTYRYVLRFRDLLNPKHW